MATSVVMPWFNPYASISSDGFVSSPGDATSVVGQIVSDGAGTVGATVGTRKTYATLSAIASDTSTGSAHSGCPIIPCGSADTLVFQFLAFQSLTNQASENYVGDNVNTTTHVQRFTVWGIRPSYANGVDDGPYIVEPLVTYRLSQTSISGTFNTSAPAYSADASGSLGGSGSFFPLINTSTVSSGTSSWAWISLSTSLFGTATTNSIDIALTPYAKSAGLSATAASYQGAIPSANDSRCITYHAVVGLHRYSHFMLATQFPANSGTNGKFNRIAAICLGLSTTMG